MSKLSLSDFQPQELPLISIVVPVYNVAGYLQRTLDSIACQTYQNLDVILVDDGSSDGSSDLMDTYALRDSRFRTIHRLSGRGVSSARNTGIRAARGEWIASADSDDILPKHAIETLYLTAVEHHTQMSMGAYNECHTSPPIRFTRRVPAKPAVIYQKAELQRYFLTYAADCNHMWSKLIRKEVFEHLRFPEGMIYEDMYMMPRIIDAAGSCAVVNKIVYHYMIRKGSASNNVNIARQMDGFRARLATVEYMKQHYPELIGLANDSVLMIGCNVLGKIEHIGGREVCPKEWDEALQIMKTALEDSALQNPLYKAEAWGIRQDPKLISKISHFVLKADQML